MTRPLLKICRDLEKNIENLFYKIGKDKEQAIYEIKNFENFKNNVEKSRVDFFDQFFNYLTINDHYYEKYDSHSNGLSVKKEQEATIKMRKEICDFVEKKEINCFNQSKLCPFEFH